MSLYTKHLDLKKESEPMSTNLDLDITDFLDIIKKSLLDPSAPGFELNIRHDSDGETFYQMIEEDEDGDLNLQYGDLYEGE